MEDIDYLFIMGAGAHLPYGLPSGKALRDYICSDRLGTQASVKDWFRNNPLPAEEQHELRLESKNNDDKIQVFRREFMYSMQPSIDYFLSTKAKDPLIQKIGKAFILHILAPYEQEDNFYVRKQMIVSSSDKKKATDGKLLPNDDDWYPQLLGYLGSDIGTFKSRKVAFITFNYDRLLDNALFKYVRYSFFDNDEPETMVAIKQVLDEKPVIHVYGQLAPLPWQTNDGRGHPFGKFTPEGKDLSSIKVLGEIPTEIGAIPKNEEQHVRDIRNHVNAAKTIVFLGYGFDKSNNSILGIDKEALKKTCRKVYLTSVGIGSAKFDEIRSMFSTESNVSLRGTLIANRDINIRREDIFRDGVFYFTHDYNCSSLLSQIFES